MFTIDPQYTEVVCGMCREPWSDPIEIRPCGHVFCKTCISHLGRCATCRGDIRQRGPANRALANMAADARATCDTCGWSGPFYMAKRHVCGQQKQNYENATAYCVNTTDGGGGGYGGTATTSAANCAAPAPVFNGGPYNSAQQFPSTMYQPAPGLRGQSTSSRVSSASTGRPSKLSRAFKGWLGDALW